MAAPSRAESWLETSLQRLANDRFRVTRQVSGQGRQFSAVAHRSRFELSKFGNCETFFVFGELPNADTEAIRRFSAECFGHALGAKSFPLPRGLFEAVFCFAVCSVDRIDLPTADAIKRTAPPKHWASGEIPVVYDKSTGSLCYFEQTPIWGAAYFKGFRNQIKQYLAES